MAKEKKHYTYARKTFTFDGKRYTVYGRTEIEAIKKMTLKKREFELGHVELCGSMSLSSWYEQYVSVYRRNCKEITQKNWDYKMKKAWLNELGHMPLKAVKPIHVQDVINRLDGKSTDYIRKVYQGLNAVFSAAVENKLIIENPCRGINKPSGTKTTRRAITQRERELILKVADTDPRYLMYLFMLFCGCRPAEAAAICPVDIDRHAKRLHIRGTKTDKANRTVPIPDYLMQRVPTEKTEPFLPVIRNTAGKPYDEAQRAHLWKSFRRNLDLAAGAKLYRNKVISSPVARDLVPYCLRHTYCTDLQKAGVDIRVAQYLMGHSSITTTANIYTHVDDLSINDAAEKMDSVIFGVIKNRILIEK